MADSEFRRGWKPLAAALVGVGCGASPIPYNTLPLVMGPIHAETGWDFGTISAGVATYGIIGALLAPVYGRLADRLGVRPVAIGCLAIFGIVFASLAIIPMTLFGYFAFWTAVGLIGIGSTPVTFSRAVSMWFSKHRGIALGIMLLGTSVAGMIVPQIAQAAIAAGGWRTAFPVLALLPLLVGVPLGLLWFREPQVEERPAGVGDAGGRLTGLTLGEAARGRRFWILWASILIISSAYGGAHIHMAQMVQLHGHSAAEAAGVMSVVALGILAGRVGIGLLFDRFWAPGVAFPAMLLPAVACFILMGTGQSLGLLMLGGFLLGFAAGAESDVIAFLAARYFGMAHYGTIYGMLYLPFGLGSAISPLLYGGVRDATGNYDLMLGAAILMFAGGGALLLALGRYPNLPVPASTAALVEETP